MASALYSTATCRARESPADRIKGLRGATVVRGSNCVLRVSATLCGLSEQRHGVMRAPYALYRPFFTVACMLQHHIMHMYGKVE